MGKIIGGGVFPHPPIIIKEIGKAESEKAIATIRGAQELSKDIREKNPTTIIFISPHGPLYRDAIAIGISKDLYGDFGGFGHGEIFFKMENNLGLINKIIDKSKDRINLVGSQEGLDHGVLVPLYFIDKEYKDFKIINITYGILPPNDLFEFGKYIKEAVEESDEDVIMVASGDLSHRLKDGNYSYSPKGKVFDEKIVDILSGRDLKEFVDFDLSLSEEAGECGLRTFMILAGFLDGYDLDREVYSYEGPYGVGYTTARLEVVRGNKFIDLAKESLEHFVRKGKYLDLKDNKDMDFQTSENGVFVSLYKEGDLRGCIGTILPVRENLGKEIIYNAVSAGLEDPRFRPVTEKDLDSLVYSVDILFPPEPIDSRDELNVKDYGVIVTSGFKRGLLLPNLEGIDRVDDQVAIALRKAGIRPDEPYSMERFKVIRYE